MNRIEYGAKPNNFKAELYKDEYLIGSCQELFFENEGLKLLKVRIAKTQEGLEPFGVIG